jgi:glycosyltransferase involved in cell wall biosynthesis
VVHYLTEELVRLGHDVTLFASGDSRTSAKLSSTTPRSLRLDSKVRDAVPYIVLQLAQVCARREEFDILHFHNDLLHYPLVRALKMRAVTTLHGRLDLDDLTACYEEFTDIPLVAISNDQRRYRPKGNWAGTVHHGLPTSLCRPNSHPEGSYLAFVGRISPEKRADRAIAIARAARIPLHIAAKIDAVDVGYHAERIAPLIDGTEVRYLGELDEAEKFRFLANARALLFPIDWPEPFGLVMIEAMACGTPVIAWRCGAVPEVLEPGVTGFIVDTIEEAVAAVHRVDEFDRARVRERFEQRFSAERMARDYLEVYRRVIAGSATNAFVALQEQI